MTEPTNSGTNKLVELVKSIPLAWKLFWSKRTPLWTKSIPLLTLAYLIWPLDLLADPMLGLGQLDDLAVLLLGLRLFVYAADRVGDGQETVGPEDHKDVVDAEFSIVDEK